MNIKAIVMDLDRTLLRSDKRISDRALAVLRSCREAGIRLMVATARPWRTAEDYCGMIGAEAVVVSNGARVICSGHRTEYGISQKSAVALLNALARRPELTVTLKTGEVAYSNKPVAEYETVMTDDLAGIAETEGALKILVSLDGDEALAAVQVNLTADLYCTVANGHLIQIMDRRATKWNGIRAMLELSGFAPEDAVYFGDDHDDIEPIKMCGLGVAVANAIDEVKAVADHIAGSNDDDGVAEFIEQILRNRV